MAGRGKVGLVVHSKAHNMFKDHKKMSGCVTCASLTHLHSLFANQRQSFERHEGRPRARSFPEALLVEPLRPKQYLSRGDFECVHVWNPPELY